MEIINEVIQIPIFKCNVHLFTGNKSNIKITLQEEFDDEEGAQLFQEIEINDDMDGSSIILSNGYKIIWIKNYSDSISDEAILVHEIFHMAINIMLSRNIQLNNDTEEVCAYLIEYLYEEILKCLENKNN